MNRNHKLFMIASLSILVTFPLLHAQTPSSDADYEIIKTDTNLVTLNVSVIKNNRPLTGLTAADFEIADAGVSVKPEFFEAQGPTSIVFVIDTSTSMRGTKWHNLTSGIKEFMRSQSANTDYTLIVFNDSPRLISQALDAKEFWKAFSAIKPDGETALYDGLALGLDQIKCLARRHKAVVLISDGEDNKSKTNLIAIQQEVLRTHTTIYVLGILLSKRDGPSTQWRDRQLLENLAAQTGGLSFFPTPDLIDKVLSNVNKEIASQYSFSYYASSRASGWRDVDVRLLHQLNDSTLRYPHRYLLK